MWTVLGISFAVLFAIALAQPPPRKHRLAGRTSNANNTGGHGEESVKRVLCQLPDSGFRIAHNIYLPLPDGTTTQIDHIAVCRYGIFVIETKTYSGWILGDENHAKWVQTLHGRRYFFQNPLRQNYKHKCALAECLGIDINYFKDVVVFAGSAKFQKPMPPQVMHLENLLGYISTFKNPVIKDSDVDRVASAIGEWCGTVSDAARENHVENLAKRHAALNLDNLQTAPPCPYCGRPMKLKVARQSGELFYGCPAFPECRGTRKVAQPAIAPVKSKFDF